MKKIFFIIAVVIVLIGLAVGVYFFFFAPDKASLTIGDPFASTGSGNVAPSGDLSATDGSIANAGTSITQQFVKITDGPVAQGDIALDVQLPVAGSGIVTTAVSLSTSSTSTSTVTTVAATTTPDVELRFIDRASGNIYSYVAHARTLTRISNKTLPGVQKASWVGDGSMAYVQFLASSAGTEHVSTYALPSNGEGGYLLEDNLAQASVAGTSTLFTLFSGSTGSIGTISGANNSNMRTLFSSVLSSLIVHPTRGDFFAANKASSALNGYGFQVNRTTGAFSRILGPFPGLTVLPSADGTALLYSYVSAGSLQLRYLNVASHTSISLPLATLSEKCAWSSDDLSAYCAIPTSVSGNLPDDWYQGAVTFSDRIWKIDLTQRVATLVLDPSQQGNISVDAVNLTVDRDEDMLFFNDKHTGALYAYDL